MGQIAPSTTTSRRLPTIADFLARDLKRAGSVPHKWMDRPLTSQLESWQKCRCAMAALGKGFSCHEEREPRVWGGDFSPLRQTSRRGREKAKPAAADLAFPIPVSAMARTIFSARAR